MTQPSTEAIRYDLELLGFPWSEPSSAAAAMAPAFGISVSDALLYVREAPLMVVKGASEGVAREYVRALHQAGAALRVLNREGRSWVVGAPTSEDSGRFVGVVEAEEGDTLPTWLVSAVDLEPLQPIWVAPEERRELPEEADLPVQVDDFALLDDEPPVRPRSTRSARSRPTAKPAPPPSPSSSGLGRGSSNEPPAPPISRQDKRDATKGAPAHAHGRPDVTIEKNPFLDRISTDEVFSQGLAALRAERQRNADPIDDFVRRATKRGSSLGKKRKKR